MKQNPNHLYNTELAFTLSNQAYKHRLVYRAVSRKHSQMSFAVKVTKGHEKKSSEKVFFKTANGCLNTY